MLGDVCVDARARACVYAMHQWIEYTILHRKRTHTQITRLHRINYEISQYTYFQTIRYTIQTRLYKSLHAVVRACSHALNALLNNDATNESIKPTIYDFNRIQSMKVAF